MSRNLRAGFLWGLVSFVESLPSFSKKFLSKFLYYYCYHVHELRLDLVRENINRAFPQCSDREIEEIAKRCYRYHTDYIMDFLDIGQCVEDRSFTVNGRENLESIRRDGGIIVSAHLGPWEAGLYVLSKWLDNLLVYGDEMTNPYANQLLREKRQQWGTTTVTGKMAPYKLIKHVNDNGVACLAADQRTGTEKYSLEFFGARVNASPILPFFANHTDKAIVPFSIVDNGCLKINIGEPLRKCNGDKSEDGVILERYFDWVETEVKKEPAQYLWFHDRWKNCG